jgi:hypothetical protein
MHARKTVCFGSNFVSCFLTPQWAYSLTYPIATQSVAVSPTASMSYSYGRLFAGPKGPDQGGWKQQVAQIDCKKRRRTERYATGPESSVPFGISKAQLKSEGSSVVQCKKSKSMTTRMGDASTFCRAFGVRTHVRMDIEDTGHHPGPEYESIIHYMHGRKKQKNSTLMFWLFSIRCCSLRHMVDC